MGDPTLRSMLAYWIKQHKDAERERDEALADGKKWFRRAKLAAQKGEAAMADEARRRALEAKERHDKAKLRIEVIEMERDVLKSGQKAPDASFKEAMRRSQHAAEEFKKLGIDPGFAFVEDLGEEVETESALDRLRGRMQADQEPDELVDGDDDRFESIGEAPEED